MNDLTPSANGLTSNITLAPSDNYTIGNINDPDRLFDFYPKGELCGNTNAGEFQIFNRFVLPPAKPGTDITSADFVLLGGASADFPLGVYVIANTWQVPEMDVRNRPVISGEPIAVMNAPGSPETHLDVTSAVNAAYHADGVITFLVGTQDSRYVCQNFGADKKLNITISPA